MKPEVFFHAGSMIATSPCQVATDDNIISFYEILHRLITEMDCILHYNNNNRSVFEGGLIGGF